MDFDDVKKAVDQLSAMGINAQVVINVPLSGSGQPAEPSGQAFTVDASSKKSKKVKLRSHPSPTADGPTVSDGSIVVWGGVKEKRYSVVYFFVIAENGLQGWIEEIYLVK